MGTYYSQLNMDERNQIHRCSNEGLSLRAIARRLNRPPSAVSREVARNTTGKHYDAGRAHVAAMTRRRRGTVKLKAGSPPVSYTHLTLPTSDLVVISVVAVSLKKKNKLEQ